MASLLVEHTVDASKGVLWSLDLHKVDGFTQAGAGCELGSVNGSSAGGDDLSTSSVNSICVQHYITHLHRQNECSGSKSRAQGTSWKEWVYVLETQIGAALEQCLDLKVPQMQAYPPNCLGRSWSKVHYRGECFLMYG